MLRLGLVATVLALDSRLTRRRVQHAPGTCAGDHSNRIGRRVLDRLLPFFSATLDFAAESN
jgi:hypothetical protein